MINVLLSTIAEHVHSLKIEEEKLNTFQKKQLRAILNIHYPTKITNKSLYKKCNETSLSSQILETRWKLFGHILRRENIIPANKAMKTFFLHSWVKPNIEEDQRQTSTLY